MDRIIDHVFCRYSEAQFARIIDTVAEIMPCRHLADLTAQERTAAEAIVSLFGIDAEAAERVYDAWDAVHCASAADDKALFDTAWDARPRRAGRRTF